MIRKLFYGIVAMSLLYASVHILQWMMARPERVQKAEQEEALEKIARELTVEIERITRPPPTPTLPPRTYEFTLRPGDKFEIITNGDIVEHRFSGAETHVHLYSGKFSRELPIIFRRSSREHLVDSDVMLGINKIVYERPIMDGETNEPIGYKVTVVHNPLKNRSI